MDPKDRLSCGGLRPQKIEKSWREKFGKMTIIFLNQDIYKSIYTF